VRDCDQPQGHAPVPQVDVRKYVHAAPSPHHTPILDTVGLVELPRRDPLGHPVTVSLSV
jgi:hypothetical protein